MGLALLPDRRHAARAGPIHLQQLRLDVTLYLVACWNVDAGKQQAMHVITRKRLNLFADQHPDTKSALANWYRLVKQHDFASFAELRSYFPAADQVGKLTVFNIGGNKVRLIAAVHYNRQKNLLPRGAYPCGV